MTITQAAKLKGVSRGTIYHAIKTGEIRTIEDHHSTIVNREDVEKYVPRAYQGKRASQRPEGVKGPGGRGRKRKPQQDGAQEGETDA